MKLVCSFFFSYFLLFLSSVFAQDTYVILTRPQKEKAVYASFGSHHPYQVMQEIKQLNKHRRIHHTQDNNAPQSKDPIFFRPVSWIGEAIADNIESLEKWVTKPVQAPRVKTQRTTYAKARENLFSNNLKEKKQYALPQPVMNALQLHNQKLEHWTYCYGTVMQQQLHQEFIATVNEAVALKASRAHTINIVPTIIDFANAGMTYNRAHALPQAYSIANFCWSLLECYENISCGLIATVDDVGRYLENVFSAINFDEYLLDMFCPELDRHEKQTQLALYQEGRKKQHEMWRKASVHYLESALSGKVFSAVAKFLKLSKAGLNKFIKDFLNGSKEVATATSAFLLPTKIVEKGIGNYLKNAIGQDHNFAHNVVRYEKLKLALKIKEFTSIINVTRHGVMRLIERGFTPNEVKDVIKFPSEFKTQADGAKVYIKQILNRYNLIVLTEEKREVVTALKNIDKKALEGLSTNYDWR